LIVTKWATLTRTIQVEQVVKEAKLKVLGAVEEEVEPEVVLQGGREEMVPVFVEVDEG
jgi:hypothetical protein